MSSAIDWYEDAFFAEPEPDSLDGGTTSAGTLWHGIGTRWGHSMHTMCSYQGMFPAKVAHYFIQAFSNPGDSVLDPFSGRGTVPLQARVSGRKAICNDLNPLAYVLSTAKLRPPTWHQLNEQIRTLESQYRISRDGGSDTPADIQMLYHPETLKQILHLRRYLLSEPVIEWDSTKTMLAGALSGIMHGSFRRDGSSRYLSISMPNTFSMSPAYVARFIREKGLKAPDQNVFECLRDKVARLYLDEIEGYDGRSFAEDAPNLLRGRRIKPKSVDLVVTSPPYLQVVNYGTSNWIRLWLLGIDEVSRERGSGRRSLDAALDHRHTYASYRQFILRLFKGIERSLADDGVAVVVIGDVADPGKAPLPLASRIWDDLAPSTSLRLAGLVEDDLAVQKKVSRIWGETKGQATSRDCALILVKREGAEIDIPQIVDWDEPYKDAGPDEAHIRVEHARLPKLQIR